MDQEKIWELAKKIVSLLDKEDSMKSNAAMMIAKRLFDLECVKDLHL